MGNTSEYTSHEAFHHDSIDHLGYDWERVANPNISPKYPLKIYLPQSTDDVVSAVKECKKLNQTLAVRSKGHSSNDLVLVEGGAVLLTEKLNQLMSVDERQREVTVQSGAVLADIDAHLAKLALGLPVIGDHNHITAGGFAAVGGISPASHRYGLFLDQVLALEFVSWEGEARWLDRNNNLDEMERILGSLGRFGVITQMRLRVIPVDKLNTVFENERTLYRDLHDFVKESAEFIDDPGDAAMERGVFVDFPIAGTPQRFGQFSRYRQTKQTIQAKLGNEIAYGVLHAIGNVAGRLPRRLDEALKYAGIAGIMLSPRYASIKNVESFTDRVLDSSVGDPTRMFIVLAPKAAYADIFRQLYEICLNVRARHEALTFVSIYVKAIKSPYLKRATGEASYAELMLYLGINPDRMTPAVLEETVEQIDDLCISHGALRYMHSRTVKDEKRLAKIDPNRRRTSQGGAEALDTGSERPRARSKSAAAPSASIEAS